MYQKFKNGSNWIKSDFHVHTPCSVLNNQFGNDFDNYVKNLFEKALKNDIAIIGITDYFIVDGYKKIKEEYLNKDKLNSLGFKEEDIEKILNILILPNIEFRISTLVEGSKVNYHVIFSNELSIEEIEDEFIKQLYFLFQGSEKRPLTRKNLEELGRKLKYEQKEFEGKYEFIIGVEQASIEATDVLSILENNTKFKNKYIIVIPADEDLSKIKWIGQGHNIRKTLIQQADCLFSSNYSTIKWALGGDKPEEFIKEFKSLKPCIHGSDAHKLDDLFKPFGNKYCWIKAIPTFEGIRQILFEPKERVYIGENLLYKKEPYNIIEKVKFIDPKNNFPNDWIYLNQNLNSIIGGKSSGKSILLYYIAKTIIPQRIDKLKAEIGENITYLEYEFEKDNEEFDFIVHWADNTEIKLSDKGSERNLTYIPQLYINHIAENRNRKSELNQIIFDILKEKKDFKDQNLEIDKKIENIKLEIQKNINLIFSKIDSIKQLEEEKREIGDLEGIRKNISILKEKISKTQDESLLTENEKLEYQRISDSIEEQKKLQKKYEENNQILDSYIYEIQEKIERDKKEYDFIFEEKGSKITELNLKEKVQNYNNKIQSFLILLMNEINEIKKQKIDIKFITDNILQLRAELTPYLNKLTSINEHKELSKTLEKEQEKIDKIQLKLNKIEEIKKELENIDLKENYKLLIELYNEKIELHKEYVDISDNIQLKVILKFNSEIFKINFSEKISKKSPLDKQFEDLGFSNNDYEFVEEKHLENILRIYDKIMQDEKIKLNLGATKKSVIDSLFADYFSLDYDLIQNGDTLLKMSPGKKGIILFQLFLQLSNADTPILIDQPEDNLDNRTVYSELNNFIKDRKNKRQIIMVSHNANLVVSTDSENIIVANQEINAVKEYNEKYRFEYISGPLEKTFRESNKNKLYALGIREHVCEILEGGEVAFKLREVKYNI